MSDGQLSRIPESFIHTVIAQTDLVPLIQERIQLKKAGNNYQACCPFHQEKTPSFTVSPQKQFYHCFGCGANGDAIAFLRAYDGLSFIEAVEQLSARLGLQVPRDAVSMEKEKVKAAQADVLSQIAAFYEKQLREHPQKAQAVEYLKRRGLTGQIAKRFGLGLAPSGWTNLLDALKDNANMEQLVQTGMIKQHTSGRYYDLFRSRIVFPIRDKKGKVIGFGGRALGEDNPKYLNSPESPLFHKSYCVYGIYEALQQRSQWDKAILVEGYMDVIGLAQQGIEGAFATLGTAVTTHHLTQLFQLSEEIIFCFDGDKAGQEAAFKAMQTVLPLLKGGRHVRFIHLPPREDPDSFVKTHGADAFLSLVADSIPLSEYFFQVICGDQPLSSLDVRAKIAESARALLSQIPDGVFKEMMFEQLAQLLASSPQVVRGEKARRYTYARYRDFSSKVLSGPAPKLSSPAFLVMAILLRNPELFSAIEASQEKITEVQHPGCEQLRHLLRAFAAENAVPKETLHTSLGTLNKFQEQALKNCEAKVALISDEGLVAELTGAFNRLVVIGQEQKALKLIQKAKASELSPEEKNLLKEILQKK